MINCAQNVMLLENIALNTVISPNFLVWKFLCKVTVSADFRANRIQIKWLASMSNLTIGWNSLNEKWKKTKTKQNKNWTQVLPL